MRMKSAAGVVPRAGPDSPDLPAEAGMSAQRSQSLQTLQISTDEDGGRPPMLHPVAPAQDRRTREEVRAMSATSVTTQPAHPPTALDQEVDRYEAVEQYSLKKIVAVWAAAALPMGVLAWVVAPLLKDMFSGPEPLMQSLLVCLTAGLAWQFVLVLILLRQEIGSFEWPRVRDALWLRAPRDPKTGRVGGKIWWWALPFLLGFDAWAAVAPELPIPDDMDLNKFLGSDTGQDFFGGAWGWFAVIAALAVFNTVLGEELLFRGVLLPRMRAVFRQAR